METVDIKRRTIFKATGAGVIVVASGGILQPVSADPLTLGAIIIASIGAAITAIGSWLSAEKSSEISQRIAAANYQHEWRIKLLGETSVTMDVAMNAYRNELLTLGLIDNIDKYGTKFAIQDGLAYFERKESGGTMNAKETYLAGVVLNKEGVIPAPLEPMENNNLSTRESYKIRDKLSHSMDVSNIALLSSRRFSLGRKPKQSEPNIEMVAFIDKREPIENGKRSVKYTATI
jgi:hypothetical protein